MANTVPDSIYYRAAGIPVALETESSMQATSIQDSLSVRQVYDFEFADTAGRNAETRMKAGSEGYQIDSQVTYKYDGTAWKAWHTTKPIAYTPAWTNLTIGNGTQAFTYTLASGRVFISGTLTLGTTSSVGTGPYFSLPLAANGYITGAPVSGERRVLGSVTNGDNGTGYYAGSIYTRNVAGVIYASPTAFTTSGTLSLPASLTSTTPFTWISTDYLNVDFSYLAD